MSVMKVGDVMTRQVVTIGPNATFKDAVEQIVETGVNGLPVVDDNGVLVGVVTEADLMTKHAFGFKHHRALALVAAFLQGHNPRWLRKAESTTVSELMTTTPATARETEPIAAAARRMLDVDVKQLPVIDEAEHVIGIVSRHDLLMSYVVSDEELCRRVSAALCSPRMVPEDHHLTFGVDDGIVTLTGTVHFPSHIPVVEAVVRGVAGVVDVRANVGYEEPDPVLRQVHFPLG